MISDFPQNDDPNQEIVSSTFRVVVNRGRWRGERINQEGRILGPVPASRITILFNTPEADAMVSALQIMPVTNPWNEDISHRPLLSNSGAMIAQIKSDLSPTRQTLRAFYEMNYVLVPDNQPRVTIRFLDYPDESDLMAAHSQTAIIRFRRTCRSKGGRRARGPSRCRSGKRM